MKGEGRFGGGLHVKKEQLQNFVDEVEQNIYTVRKLIKPLAQQRGKCHVDAGTSACQRSRHGQVQGTGRRACTD